VANVVIAVPIQDAPPKRQQYPQCLINVGPPDSTPYGAGQRVLAA